MPSHGTIASSNNRYSSLLLLQDDELPPSEPPLKAPPPSKPPLKPPQPDPVDDLTVEILWRLPIKSLVRFKSVCKSWNHLFSTNSDFANSHLHRSSTDPTLRYHRLLAHHSKGNVLLLSRSLHSLIDNQSSSLPLFDYASFELSSDASVIGSCNGLICCVVRDPSKLYYRRYNYHSDHDFRYMNPSTGLKSDAPYHSLSGNYGWLSMYGFGYDHLNDTYKTVAIYSEDFGNYYYREAEKIGKTIVMVYALGGRSWTKIQCFPFLHTRSRKQSGIFVTGALNWLAAHLDGSMIIVCVDIGNDTCGEFLPPDVAKNVLSCNLHVLGGCLCFSYDSSETQFVLWQMKVYGVAESWTILLNITYPSVEIDHFCHYAQPILMLDNGELLLQMNGFRLYNPRHNSFKFLTIRRNGMILYEGAHIESLVSPCPTRR